MDEIAGFTQRGSTDPERECQNCGRYVTKQFVRVFGGRDGKVYGCTECLTGRQIRSGEAAEP